MTWTTTGSARPAKAATLADALPWLMNYHGKTIVVKYGGNAMTDETLKRAFAQDIVFLRYAGFKPVVVHGGGPQISSMLDRLGIESEFQGGLRVTTEEAMDVVRMVLVGKVQRELVGLLNEHGPLAVGLSGEDAGLFTATRTNTVVDGEEVDLGLVGEVARRASRGGAGHRRGRPHPGHLVGGARTPTASCTTSTPTPRRPPSRSRSGPRSSWCSPTSRGSTRDWPDSDDVIGEISPEALAELMPSLSTGMVPKMEACLQAVQGGVQRATVVDGREPHAVLLEIFTDEGVGTQVLPGVPTKIRSALYRTSASRPARVRREPRHERRLRRSATPTRS